MLVGATASERLLEYFTLLKYWYCFGFLLRMTIMIIIVRIVMKIIRRIIKPTTAAPAIIGSEFVAGGPKSYK